MSEDRYARAMEVLASMGNDPTSMANWRAVDPVVGPKIDQMLGEFCWGGVWADDALDLRTRRVVTLVANAVLGTTTPLSGHIRMSLEQGFDRQEVLNIFVHLIPYVGFPVALTAIQTAVDVFTALDQQEEGEG